MIKTVIFCGGQGTRIRDVADNIPKPLISVGDRPILWHIMKLYSSYGLADFVLTLGYKGWLIKEFFLNYQKIVCDFSLQLGTSEVEYHNGNPEQDWQITMAETGIKTQTGGRLWRSRKYLEDSEIFCVTYGDGLANLNINALIEFHRGHGRIGTVTGVRPAGRFGILDTEIQEDDTLLAVQFQEKPQSLQGLINGGFFVFDHRLWDFVRDDDELIFEREPLMNLAKAGELAVFEHSGFWQPMDTYREWKLLNQLWDSNEAPWKIW